MREWKVGHCAIRCRSYFGSMARAMRLFDTQDNANADACRLLSESGFL